MRDDSIDKIDSTGYYGSGKPGTEGEETPAVVDRLLTIQEVCSFLPLIVTALHTGMRKSELLNLKWPDIDLGQHTITVQSKDDWHTKNYKSRTLQLTPVLYEVLKNHRKLQSELGVHSEYVFTYRGKRIKTDVRKSLRKVLKAAGLEDITLHTLRHWRV